MEKCFWLVRSWGLRAALVLFAVLPAPAAEADVIDFSDGALPVEGTYLTSWLFRALRA